MFKSVTLLVGIGDRWTAASRRGCLWHHNTINSLLHILCSHTCIILYSKYWPTNVLNNKY